MSRNGKLPGKTNRSRNGPIKRKTPIWIRPRGEAFNFRLSELFSPLPPFRMKWKYIFRLVMDVLGLLIFVGATCFVLAQIWASWHLDPCVGASQCSKDQHFSGASFIQFTALSSTSTVVSASPTAIHAKNVTPSAILTPIVSSVASPIPTITPPPLAPLPAHLKAVPSSVTVISSLVCATGLPIMITLRNMGDQTLLWWEDTTQISQDLRLVNSTGTYLLYPGQQVAVSVYCASRNIVGQYQLKFLSNGGTAIVYLSIRA